VLIDNHGRTINYLRLAVTDRCNLRCFYCMPEEGLRWLGRSELMTAEEMLRMSRLLVGMGIDKIRITGGEPFVRKDIMELMQGLSIIPGLETLTLTTNGVLTAPHVPDLKKWGVKSVNLSLDTLDRERFISITHRDELQSVLDTLDALLEYGIDVKINAVVMDGKNAEDILPLAEMTRNLPVSVRFIEEMPFNGQGDHYSTLPWDHLRILEAIRTQFPDILKLPDPLYSTSSNYQVPGFKGTIGVIAAFSRTFCGTCNRIRITPTGVLKTCLYDGGVLNLKALFRAGRSDQFVKDLLLQTLQKRFKDGWEAEKMRSPEGHPHESMATIGG
jgi:cyclic pyranopterin phosphate synthase